MNKSFFIACLLGLSAFLSSASAMAQSTKESVWQQQKNNVSKIWKEGEDALYFSGKAHHGRGSYTAEKLSELNENAWGFGYGKTLRDQKGNDESIYLFGISDSHKKPQIMLGYAYEYVWKIPHTPLEVSAGGTLMLMHRQDIFGGIPFPAPLPLASIGLERAKLMFSYVPRLSKNGNNGDVLLIFGRVQF